VIVLRSRPFSIWVLSNWFIAELEMANAIPYGNCRLGVRSPNSGNELATVNDAGRSGASGSGAVA
jgi:hypothetical protein